MREIVPGIYQWSWYSEEKQLDFNGHLITAGEERVLIDPPPLPDADLDRLRALGPLTSIVLTNADHTRQADAYRTLFKAPVLIHELDAPLADLKPDRTYRDRERLPAGLLAIHLRHQKTPGETALYLEQPPGILILGDALIGKPAGALSFFPREKYADPRKAMEGLQLLLVFAFDAVLVGDGTSILSNGSDVVERALGL